MDSLRKTMKSQNSLKHSRRMSSGGGGGGDSDESHEALPILFDHDTPKSASSSDSHGDVIVKIDNNNGDSINTPRDLSFSSSVADQSCSTSTNNNTTYWRDPSYESFWNEENVAAQSGGGGFYFQQQQQQQQGGGGSDPASTLLKQFLNKQKESGKISLDLDLEMDELQNDRILPPIAESPNPQISKDLRVSFQHYSSTLNSDGITEVSGRLNDTKNQSFDDEDEDDEEHEEEIQNYNAGSSIFNGIGVSSRTGRGSFIRCQSNISFQTNASLLRTKTKSRLIDPPPDEQQYRKSGQLLSGYTGKGVDEDDEDPFAVEDLPGEFKKANLSALTILQWVSFILIVTAFICSLLIPAAVKKTLWELHLWKWELLILVLICGRLLSGWGIRIIVFFIERNFMLRKRVLYFVYGVRKAVQNCLWLGLVLTAWHFMFDKKVEREVKNKVLPYVTKVIVCLLVGTLVWLVKTLFVKVLASSFHMSTYFDRIQESLFNQYVIQTLSGSPLVEMLKKREESKNTESEVQKLQNAGAKIAPDVKATAFQELANGRAIGSGRLQRSSRFGKSMKVSGVINKQQPEQGITIDHLHKFNQKNISAWNMKRLINIIRHGVITTLDESILDSTQEEEAKMLIRSEYEAKLAAKNIFNNVAKSESKFIYLQDLQRFMRDDEAVKAMSLFEGANENKRVNKKSLKNWVVNAFRERRALALTLTDTKTAVRKLHHIVNFVVGIIILVLWLLILEITTTHILVIISSQLLMVVFVFGNTCKTTFEAIVFLFVMHPFDVGDRCEIDGVQMIVEEMNILTTVFLRFDNQKITYPNTVLATMPVGNYYRSPDMGETIDFCIHVSTPAEKIALVKQRISGYIEGKTDHWYLGPMFVVRDVDDMNRLKISIWFQHRMNHQDMGERWVRRAFVVEELIRILKDLEVEYRMLPLDINVRNMPTLTSNRLPSNWTACTN